jgi:mono/diheme cytochrome c family protein
MKCVAWIINFTAIVALIGCKTKPVTQLEYMPDMSRQISVRAQEFDPNAPNGIAMRQPVPGTVPRDHLPYPYSLADTTEADKLINPLPATAEVLAAGKKYFDTYCIVCHGPGGSGDGYIIPKFTAPPSLYSDKLLKWPDGRIYHTITLGQGLMSSYATQLLPEQRWAAIHYVRQLQKAARPTDVAEAGKKK